MATTAREGVGSPSNGNKEIMTKRATTCSPNHPHIKKTPTKSTPHQLSSPSHPKAASKTTTPSPSSSSEKPVPNYLKPTISSSLEFSRARRSSTTDSSSTTTTHQAAAKPTLNRIRSFDKPPFSAQLHKAIHGSSATSKEEKTTRSTSFSGTRSTMPSLKSNVSERSPSSKNLKGEPATHGSSTLRHKDRAGPTRRSSSVVTPREFKKTTAAIAKNKAPRSVTSESSAELEIHDKDPLPDHVIMTEDETGHGDDQIISLPELSEMPGKEEPLGDPPSAIVAEKIEDDVVDLEEQIIKEVTGDGCDAGQKVADHEVVEQQYPVVEKVEEEVKETKEPAVKDDEGDKAMETKSNQDNDQHMKVKEEGSKKGIDESTHRGKETKGVGEKEEEDQKEENSPKGEKKEGLVEKEGEVEGERKQELETKEVEEEAEAEQSPSSSGVKAQGGGGWKKEAQVYNEVIEETATKLMGGGDRKSKVRALAGAFQTVINLQDTKN